MKPEHRIKKTKNQLPLAMVAGVVFLFFGPIFLSILFILFTGIFGGTKIASSPVAPLHEGPGVGAYLAFVLAVTLVVLFFGALIWIFVWFSRNPEMVHLPKKEVLRAMRRSLFSGIDRPSDYDESKKN